jgi:hypothetical protein
MRKMQVYVPPDDKLREDILRLHHDTPLVGHPGQTRTEELISRSFWWPSLTVDVKRYVGGCETCQRTKPNRQKRTAPLNPNKIPERPWQIISEDLIGPLPPSNGYDAIYVAIDRMSKMAKFQPCNIDLSAGGTARILRDRVFRNHGLPETIISDRGPQFVAKFMKELYRLLGIHGNPSTAFHPQTDGQTERANQEVEQYLRIFSDWQQADWAEWLPLAEFAYNDKLHSATGYSPFYLNYGQHPWKGVEPRGPSRNVSAQEFANHMKRTHNNAKAALEKAAKAMKHAYDKKKAPSREYSPGDKVWLEATNIKTTRPSKKLDNKRLGPFPVIEKVGPAAYRLELPPTWKIHPVFNELLLTPYCPPAFPSQERPLPPPPDVIDGTEEYDVEEILDSRMKRGKMEYLVHWKGYPHEENTWEPELNVKNSKDLIDAFHQKHVNAPRRLPAGVTLRFLQRIQYTEEAASGIPLYPWDNGKLPGKPSRLSRVDTTLKGR